MRQAISHAGARSQVQKKLSGRLVSPQCSEALHAAQRLTMVMGGDIANFPILRAACGSELSRLCDDNSGGGGGGSDGDAAAGSNSNSNDNDNNALHCLLRSQPRVKERHCAQVRPVRHVLTIDQR